MKLFNISTHSLIYYQKEEQIFVVRDKIFKPSIKRDIMFMKELSKKAPVVFRIFSVFQIETSIPYAFKQLFVKLIFLSRKPFQNNGEASNSANLVFNREYLMSFFQNYQNVDQGEFMKVIN